MVAGSVRYKLSDVLTCETSSSPAKRPTGLRSKKQQRIARERYTNVVTPKGRRKSKKKLNGWVYWFRSNISPLMVSPASIRRVLLDRYGQFMNKAQVIRGIGKTQLAEAIERNQLRRHHARRAFSGSRNTRVFFLTLDVAAYLAETRSRTKNRLTAQKSFRHH